MWQGYLELQGGKLALKTRSQWERTWRTHIGPRLGAWPIGRITVVVVKEFLAQLERAGVRVPTRQKVRAILNRVFEEAAENGEIATNPVSARGTRVKPDPVKKARTLSPQEVRRGPGHGE